MKINVMSDLHLEFPDAQMDPGTADVLILAGDICTAESFVMRSVIDLKSRYLEFFEKCVEGYDRVFYVMGNHEHYNFFYDETEKVLRENLPEGITLLHNQSEYYNGVHFVGATMWTDFDNGNEEIMKTSQNCMNDYNCVYHKDTMNRLTPKETLKDHHNTVEWFQQVVPTLKQGPVVMITHHAPSLLSFRCGYREESAMPAYVSDQEKFIRDNNNIMMWVHCHIHETNDYMVGQCRVVSNPRGYCGYQLNETFDVDKELELNN